MAGAQRRRVGYFGGTFNPIHYGHLRLAEEVADFAHLDEVMFVPSGTPPHRRKPQVSAPQRLEMVRLAVAGNPRFTVNPIEVEADQQSCNYTYDTITRLTQTHPDLAISLICGSDIQHQKWYRFDDIIALVEGLYVVFRPGDDAASMEACMRSRLHGQEELLSKYHWVPTWGNPVSSTKVREIIALGQSVRYLVPPAVAAYIAEQSLYATGDEE